MEILEKESHSRWKEVHLSLDEVTKLFGDYDNEEGKPEFDNYYVTLVFEKGSVSVDEMWGLKAGKVFSSSFLSGVVDWSHKQQQYIESVRMCPRELGGFVRVEAILDDELEAAIEKFLK